MSLSTDDGSSSDLDSASTNETEHVFQAQAGNVSAFEKLYSRYYDPISSYLIHMVGNDGVGYELAQETFFKAWRALPSLREASTFRSWLYRIATNIAYDHLRRSKHHHSEPLDTVLERKEQITKAGPEEQVEAEEFLRVALSRIPAKYRACLILYHIEGIPKRKIAELLEIKESSVGTYVSNGLEELRQIYARLSAENNSKEKEC